MQQQDKTVPVCFFGEGGGVGRGKRCSGPAGLRMQVNFLGIKDMGVFCFFFVLDTHTQKAQEPAYKALHLLSSVFLPLGVRMTGCSNLLI